MRKIKKYITDIVSWVKSLFCLLYWFLVHCYKSDFKNYVKRDKKGGSIDIIVNGPSFTKQIDYVKNDGNDKCMVNFAANTELFWDLKPSYYCVADPCFFLEKARKKEVESFINNLKKVDWDMQFFIKYTDYKHYVKNSALDNLSHIMFVPYHSTPLPFSFKFKKLAFWLFRKGQAMPNPMSVSVPVIMNIINAGFSFINLYGYDQNWIHNIVVNEKNQVCHQDTHFYNVKGQLNLWKKNENETFRVYEILHTQVELFEAYWFIKEYLNYLGNVKVINRSPTSLLDAFDRE